MIGGSISRRYAKALLAIGIEKNTYEAFGKELEQFALLMENEELRDTLANPSYPQTKRKAIISQLADKLSLSALMKNFILLLTDRNRLEFVEGIHREYRRMVDQHAGRIRASITSAAPLTSGDLSRLQTSIEGKTGKKAVLEQETDPELIAGIVTQIGSIVYDGSIRTSLEQIRQTLLEGEQ